MQKLALLLTVVVCVYAGDAMAQASYTVNDHKFRNGTDVFRLTKDDKSFVDIEVKVSPDDTPASKAQNIADKIGNGATRTGATVNVPVASHITGIELFKNQSGEGDKAVIPGRPPIHQIKGIIDFHGIIKGLDDSGDESIFQSALGFDGFSAASNLTFSSLSGATIDDLLHDTYVDFLAALPASLQPDLHLDLSTESITFDFPVGTSNDFVENFTSDSTTEATLGIGQVIPESSTLLLLSTGLAGLLGYAWRRRKQAA